MEHILHSPSVADSTALGAIDPAELNEVKLLELSLKAMQREIVRLLARKINPKNVINERSLTVADRKFVAAKREVSDAMGKDAHALGIHVHTDGGFQYMAGGSVKSDRHIYDTDLDSDFRADRILQQVYMAVKNPEACPTGKYAVMMFGLLSTRQKPRSRDLQSEMKRRRLSAEFEPRRTSLVSAAALA